MLFLALVLPIVTAALSPRQSTPALTSDPRIPVACDTSCTTTYPIYDLCTARQVGCEAICYAGNWELFVQCQQCLLNSAGEVNEGVLKSAQGVITKMAAACTTNGTVVTAGSMTASLAPAASQTAKLGDDYRGGTNPQSGRFAAGAAEGDSSPFNTKTTSAAHLALPSFLAVMATLGGVVGVAVLI